MARVFQHIIGVVERISRRDENSGYLAFRLKCGRQSWMVAGSAEKAFEPGNRVEAVGYVKATRRPEYAQPLFQAVFLREVAPPNWARVADLCPAAIGERAEIFWSLLSLVEEQGGTAEQAQQLFEAASDQSLARLREDPYALVAEAGGNFALADRLGRTLGLPLIAEFRLRAGLLSLLSEFDEKAPTIKEFRDSAVALLAIPEFLLDEHLRKAESEGELTVRDGKVYQPLPAARQEEAEASAPIQITLDLVPERRAEPSAFLSDREEPGGRIAQAGQFSPGPEAVSKGIKAEASDSLLARLCRLRDAEGSLFLLDELEAAVRALEGPATLLSNMDRQRPFKVLMACGPASGQVCAATRLVETMAACGGRVAVCAPSGQALQRACIDSAETRLALVSPRILNRITRADLVVLTEADNLSLSQWDMLLEAVPNQAILLVLGEGRIRSRFASLLGSEAFVVLKMRDRQAA